MFFFKALVSLFLTFLLLEASLRFGYALSPQIKYFLYSSRYDLNFEKIKTFKDLTSQAPCPLKPLTSINGFITNSKGFYTPDYQREKSENTLRIGFIGDSFLIGVVPYRQNFVNIFQEKMQEAIKDKKIEVINWGIPCVGPQFEEKILEIEGFKTKPDLLLWMFFVGNDFTDELFPGEKLPLPNLLTKNFYTLRLLRNLQKTLTEQPLKREVAPAVGGETYDEGKPTFSQEQFLKIQAEKLRLFSQKTFPHQSWQGIQKTLLTFQKNCQSSETQCLLIIIPDENQISQALLDQVLKIEKRDKESLAMDYPQQLLGDFLEANNFLYLDLLPVFRQVGEEKKLYHPADTHWSIAGNQLAAEEIYKYVKMNWLKR